MKLKNGLVQIYTGDGKGKTTAALGLALRAAGAGLKVYVCQFIKGKPCSEHKTLKNIKGITLKQCGRGRFIRGDPDAKDRECARKGFAQAAAVISSEKYDIVILDEINIALKFGLLDIEDVIAFIRSKPTSVELILTGRRCPIELFKYADLITEMKEIKHPYQKGISARRGIEY